MIVLAEHWQSVAEMLVGKMLNGVAEGLILALCGWLLLHTMRRRNSSTRFAVWLATLAAVVALPVIHGAFASGNPASTAHFAFRMPVSWAIGIFLVWTVIAGAGLAKIVFGFWQLHMLRRNCLLLNAADLQVDLSTMPATNRFHRRVRICASDKVRVPAAIGFFRPAIVIPTWARKELTPSELNAVVLHELAHLRRDPLLPSRCLVDRPRSGPRARNGLRRFRSRRNLGSSRLRAVSCFCCREKFSAGRFGPCASHGRANATHRAACGSHLARRPLHRETGINKGVEARGSSRDCSFSCMPRLTRARTAPGCFRER
jgi:hypothetical protein